MRGPAADPGASATGDADGRRRTLTILAAAAPALLVPPLLGVAAAGGDPGDLLAWPPRPGPYEQPGFSAPVFAAVALIAGAAVALLAVPLARAARTPARAPRGRFPWWGAVAAAALVACWVAAWTRSAWLAPVQAHTFTPLWLAWIVLVNALLRWRTGSCPLTGAPGRFAALFAVSAVFWWFFELLNVFVRNWHYVGVEHLGDAAYVAFSSAAFATVLPAVVCTARLLECWPVLDRAFASGPAIRPARPRLVAALVLVAGLAGLFGIGLAPTWCFPAVWLSPLLVLEPLRVALGARPTFPEVARGDWRRVAAFALAGLACGVLWELWNHHSLAGWRYDVPHVDVLHVFRMPLLGYAGYLPFGIECAVVATMVLGDRRDSRHAPAPHAGRSVDNSMRSV